MATPLLSFTNDAASVMSTPYEASMQTKTQDGSFIDVEMQIADQSHPELTPNQTFA